MALKSCICHMAKYTGDGELCLVDGKRSCRIRYKRWLKLMVENILNNGYLLNSFFQSYAVDIKTVPDALMGQVALLPELLKD